MEYQFQHPKTFRAEILHQETAGMCVLYALHGYGQLSRYFIQKFRHLPNDMLIVAPEGMHRFYLNGNSGRVGASWMTKEGREQDIQDNISWLSELDERISSIYEINKRIVVGFSQGGTTAIRWVARNPLNYDKLIIWGSDFPSDENASPEAFSSLDTHFVIGDNDEFIHGERRPQLVELYTNLHFNIHTYPGPHDINESLLKKLVLL